MIIKVDNNNVDNLVEFAHKLWPDAIEEELKDEFLESLDEPEEEAYLYKIEDVGYVGFIQLSLRHDYVEGCESSPVAYVEGVYVEEEYRRHGIARQLIDFAEAWGREHGCTELASDCELDNKLSINFHSGAGFVETNRIVCFKKNIGNDYNVDKK